ncbi:alpha/beta hydrolase [Curtobacterium flaccumfaciens]|nr:alpha/beta hydrolase [Curtobacterium flaccumfaciens]
MTLDTRGSGRAAIAIGDLDSAADVTVVVPGMFFTVTGQMTDFTNTANDLYTEQATVAGLAAPGSGNGVAVVAWMGYRTPDLSNILSLDLAKTGAQRLERAVDGLRAGRVGDQPRLNVVAHSYGSTMALMALSSGGCAPTPSRCSAPRAVTCRRPSSWRSATDRCSSATPTATRSRDPGTSAPTPGPRRSARRCSTWPEASTGRTPVTCSAVRSATTTTSNPVRHRSTTSHSSRSGEGTWSANRSGAAGAAGRSAADLTGHVPRPAPGPPAPRVILGENLNADAAAVSFRGRTSTDHRPTVPCMRVVRWPGALLTFVALSALAGMLVAVAVTPGVAVAGEGASGAVAFFEDLPSYLDIQAPQQVSSVYATKGGQQVKIASFYAENRTNVASDAMAKTLKQAAIDTEDPASTTKAASTSWGRSAVRPRPSSAVTCRAGRASPSST